MSDRGMFARSVPIAVVALLLLGALAAPVAAAPPSNDDRGDATTVGALPFQDSIDTSEATPQVNDPECSSDAGNPTVWYSFTPVESGRYGVTTFGSEYDTTLTVAEPNNGGLDIIDCIDDADGGFFATIIWQAVAGQEYLIMAGACCGGPGGALELELRKDPRKVNVSVTIASGGLVNRKGGAVIHGRVECKRGAGASGFIGASVRQEAGRFYIRGGTEVALRCNRAWTARMPGNIGRFAPGRVMARAEAFACSAFGCDSDTAREPVRLRAAAD